MEQTIEVSRPDGTTRTMSRIQFGLIGSNPDTNGGWSQTTTKPAEAEDDEELTTARTRYEELTGNKPGNKKLETLLSEIEKQSKTE